MRRLPRIGRARARTVGHGALWHAAGARAAKRLVRHGFLGVGDRLPAARPGRPMAGSQDSLLSIEQEDLADFIDRVKRLPAATVVHIPVDQRKRHACLVAGLLHRMAAGVHSSGHVPSCSVGRSPSVSTSGSNSPSAGTCGWRAALRGAPQHGWRARRAHALIGEGEYSKAAASLHTDVAELSAEEQLRWSTELLPPSSRPAAALRASARRRGRRQRENRPPRVRPTRRAVPCHVRTWAQRRAARAPTRAGGRARLECRRATTLCTRALARGRCHGLALRSGSVAPGFAFGLSTQEVRERATAHPRGQGLASGRRQAPGGCQPRENIALPPASVASQCRAVPKGWRISTRRRSGSWRRRTRPPQLSTSTSRTHSRVSNGTRSERRWR